MENEEKFDGERPLPLPDAALQQQAPETDELTPVPPPPPAPKPAPSARRTERVRVSTDSAPAGVAGGELIPPEMLKQFIKEAMRHVLVTQAVKISEEDRRRLLVHTRAALKDRLRNFTALRRKGSLARRRKQELLAIIENLESQMQHLKSLQSVVERAHGDQEFEHLGVRIETLQKQVEGLEAELDDARLDARRKQEKLHEIQQQKELSRWEDETREQKIQELETQLDAMRKKAKRTEMEEKARRAAEKKAASAEGKVKELEKRLALLEADRENLGGELADLKKELDNRPAAETGESPEGGAEKIAKLESENEELRRRAVEAIEQFDEFSTENKALLERSSAGELEIKRLEEKIRQIQQAAGESESRAEESESRAEALEEKYLAAIEKLENIEQERTGAEAGEREQVKADRHQQAVERLQSLNTRLEKMLEEKKEAGEEAERLEARVRDFLDNIEKLDIERDEPAPGYKARAGKKRDPAPGERLEAAEADIRKIITGSRRKIATLSRMNVELTGRIEHLESRVEELGGEQPPEIAALNEKILELEADKDELTGLAEELQSEVNRLAEKASDSERDSRQLRKEIEQAREAARVKVAPEDDFTTSVREVLELVKKDRESLIQQGRDESRGRIEELEAEIGEMRTLLEKAGALRVPTDDDIIKLAGKLSRLRGGKEGDDYNDRLMAETILTTLEYRSGKVGESENGESPADLFGDDADNAN